MILVSQGLLAGLELQLGGGSAKAEARASVDYLMTEFDTDKDGSITQEEFYGALSR